MMDIHLHDTYFVFSRSIIIRALSLFMLLLWGVYKLYHPCLFSEGLSWFHIGATIVSSVVICIAINFQKNEAVPRKYFDFSSWDNNNGHIWMLIISGGVLVSCQLLFLINFIAGFVKSKS